MSIFDQAFCWGQNSQGQLGDGTRTDRLAPVHVHAGGVQFRQVTASGGGHSCGVSTDNLAYCWGLNNEGQLGDGTFSTRLTPVRVAGEHAFRAVDAGTDHTCGATRSDLGFCWGSNAFGKLGDGTFSRRPKPVRVGRTT